MTPWLIFCFTVILLHIERKLLLKENLTAILPLKSELFGKFQRFNAIDGNIEMLKKVEFLKISVKMKILKCFVSPKQQSAWMKLFSPPPDKSFLRLGIKNVWTEIYRKFCENAVLGRLEMVHCKCFFFFASEIHWEWLHCSLRHCFIFYRKR